MKTRRAEELMPVESVEALSPPVGAVAWRKWGRGSRVALAIFEELPSDDDSAPSNNRDTDDEDYVENVPQGENISSDDEEIDEIQCPFTSHPELKWGKLYKKK
ncbi:hypothetical protein TNCV_4676021 [Trichonephila clavipes]|nr:hypothetical protein TNCV_4676021 [Trichonephila clavipes]